MIVEKKGKTTIYKCGKRYEKKIKIPKGSTFKDDPISETVTEPESIPDKKNKKKTLKEG